MKKIYYTKPSISDLELKYVNDAARNGWGEKCYEYIYEFEDLLLVNFNQIELSICHHFQY